jgi:hypothetical protein
VGHRVSFCTLSLVAVLLASGCPQQPPEVKIAETRNQYFLEPTGMLVQEIEAEVSSEDFESGDVGEAEEPPAEEMAGDEEGSMEPEGARTVKVLFDLVVRFDGLREALPGITIEISHSDPFDKEKAHYRQWIETAGMKKGNARQISFEREIPDYESGDKFSIEYREHIPREEWGDYKEFESVAAAP